MSTQTTTKTSPHQISSEDKKKSDDELLEKMEAAAEARQTEADQLADKLADASTAQPGNLGAGKLWCRKTLAPEIF